MAISQSRGSLAYLQTISCGENILIMRSFKLLRSALLRVNLLLFNKRDSSDSVKLSAGGKTPIKSEQYSLIVAHTHTHAQRVGQVVDVALIKPN